MRRNFHFIKQIISGLFPFLFIIAFVQIPNSINAQGWERAYGGSNEDIAHSLIETSDSNYLVVGFTKIQQF